jgi:hypothetical protein
MYRLLFVAFVAGCHNPCQDLCHDMADFARSECDIEVSDSQVEACVDMQGENDDRDALKVCRQYDEKRDIEDNWGCEELEIYFAGP